MIRKAFRMPAVGDLRNRLTALADPGFPGQPAVYSLFSYRMSQDQSQHKLRQELHAMCQGTHPLLLDISDPMRSIMQHHLRYFFKKMPEDFDLRGASVGNLLLAASYLESGRRLAPALSIYSRLISVRGGVIPILERDLHLVAELEGGERILGQHLLTGKECPEITAKILRLYLTDDLAEGREIHVESDLMVRDEIRQADLICYPMGSFYTSLIANLLPEGVGSAVAAAPCPKVFVPNTVRDSESIGLGVKDMVTRLLSYLKRDRPGIHTHDLLNYVLLDQDLDIYSESYPGPLDDEYLASMLGVRVIRCRLVSNRSRPFIDPDLLAEQLISMAGKG